MTGNPTLDNLLALVLLILIIIVPNAVFLYCTRKEDK